METDSKNFKFPKKSLQKPELQNLSNTQKIQNKLQKSTNNKVFERSTRSSTNIRENIDIFDGDFLRNNEENYNNENKQKLMNIDETKIKTEGDDTLFSASIFEDDDDEFREDKFNKSNENEEGWLFDNEEKNQKIVDKKKITKKTKTFKR